MTWFRSKPRLKDPVKHSPPHRSTSGEVDPIMVEINKEFRRMQNQIKETKKDELGSDSPNGRE